MIEVIHTYTKSYTDTWERTEYFCPFCGRRGLYQNKTIGDRGSGEMLCPKCEKDIASFHPPITSNSAEVRMAAQTILAEEAK